MTAHLRGLAGVWLATAGILPSLAAGAAPHAPPREWKNPAGPPTERDVWLKRLVGRYRVDGLVDVVAKGSCGQLPPAPSYCETIKGVVDCVGIGTGPGVQCILQVKWQDLYETVWPPADDAGVFNLPGGVGNLAPAMVLFGLDPAKSAVDYLLVDQYGLPEGGLGFNNGTKVSFQSKCVNWPTLLNAMRRSRPTPHSCERILRIDARSEASVVYLSMDIEIDDEPFTRYEMTLRRVPQVRTSNSLAGPPGAPQRQ